MSVIFSKILTSVILIAISVYVWITSDEFPADGNHLPQFCAAIAIAILFVMLLKDLMGTQKKRVRFDFSYHANKHFVLLFLSILYVISIFFLGYYLSTTIFLILGCFLVGVRNSKAVILTVIVTLPLMYAFFELFLQAGLPRGLII